MEKFALRSPVIDSGQSRHQTGSRTLHSDSFDLWDMNSGLLPNYQNAMANDFERMVKGFHSNGISPSSDSGHHFGYPQAASPTPRAIQSSNYNPDSFVKCTNSNAFSQQVGSGVLNSSANIGMNNRESNLYSPTPQSYQSGQHFFPSQTSYRVPHSRPFSDLDSPQELNAPSHSWSNGPFGLNMSDPFVERAICRGCGKLYKWPTTLDCMHVFCFNCICTKLDTSTQSIVCIFCNHVTSVAEGAYKLLLDFAMCKYMFRIKLTPFACTACTRDTDAVICCTSCPAYLCEHCEGGHRSMRIFSNHSLSPIAKVVRHNGEIEPMCERHIGEPLTKYCVTCPQMICDKCMADHSHEDSPGSQSPDHDLQEPFNLVITKLRTCTEDAIVKHKEVVEMKKKIPEMKNTIDTKKRIAKRNVDEYTDYCKNVMEQHRAHAHEMIERSAEEMEAKLAKYNKLLAMIESELEAVASFNNFTVDEGTPSMIMTSLEFMENSYKKAVGEYSEVCGKNTADGLVFEIVFNPDYPKTSDFIQENFASVTYKINDQDYDLQNVALRPELSMPRNFSDYGLPNCSDNYGRFAAATADSMTISTWNTANEQNRKGTFIPALNSYRIRTSFVHVFGDYGRGDYAFTEPSGQAYFEDGSYVICDTNNHRIVYYSKVHEYIRSIGMPPNLPALAEDHENEKNGKRPKNISRQERYLYFPNRVAICPKTNHIVATERPPSHDIQIFTIEGEFIGCFGGNILQHPRGVTVDENGVIIVVECKVMKLTMFDHDGTQLASHSLAKDLEFPNDVAAKDGKIYISDNRGHCVKVFDYDAQFLQKIGNDNITYFPIGVSINSMNQVVVTDNHNTFNITVFDLEGRVLHIFESITKHAQCHNVAVHPSKLELVLTTKDCNVYFFNYDPTAQHPPPAPTSRGSNHFLLTRRGRNITGNGNPNGPFLKSTTITQ